MRYPDAPDDPTDALIEWHLTRGQRLGHSPNRYFDEEWQRHAWPGILALIEAGSVPSAFDAWCRGPNATRPPHWLFDPREYRVRYAALTDEVLEETGFANRYHHYLSHGAAEGRIGHPLFDPAVYLAALDPAEAEAAAAMPYLHYLRGLESGAPERRTSLLFDPDWYRDRYPDAARSVAEGQYRSVLEHYLCNDRPTEFDPSPWFSEAYYLARYPALADSITPEHFRNGFAHFLTNGLREGRSPHPDLDLAWYASRDGVQMGNEAWNAYTHWITIGHTAGLPGRAPPEIKIAHADAVALYQRRAETVLPLYGRHKLDFTHRGTPAISVIMTIRRHFAATMVSLAALRAQYHGDIELILIDSGSDPGTAALSAATSPKMDLETHVTGATILRFGAIMHDTAAREAGLICASANVLLLLGDGVDLAPGAVGNALARLTGDPGIGAVGGRLIRPDGMLSGAGGIIWRDGQIQPYSPNVSPSAAEINFVRDTDFCTADFLLARRDVLASLPEQAAGIAGTTHDAADLCVRIRQAGFRVVYDPGVVAFLTTNAPARSPAGKAAFVAAHANYLATRPSLDAVPNDPGAIIHARSPPHRETRVLFIEDSIPLRRIGSGFVRSNDVLRAMEASGAMITVVPMRNDQFPLSTIRAEMPDTVEVMHELTAADLPAFLAARRNYYDVVWVARTHNLDRIHETLAALEATTDETTDIVSADYPGAIILEWPAGPNSVSSQPVETEPVAIWRPADFDSTTNVVAVRETDTARSHRRDPGTHTQKPAIVIDTEAVASMREAARATLLNHPFDLDAALRHEFRHLDAGMSVVAVTETEAAIIRAHHRGPVSVLGHTVAAVPTPRRFEERSGMLFVGAIHDMDHPNYEGLAWFIDEVLPLVEQTLRWETRLTVAGYTAPGVALDRFKGHARVTLRGAVTDLTPLYDTHLVFVAPGRFAAGIPYKVHEAAASGLPVVTTTLLAQQLGWPDADCIAAVDGTDPAGFAARVVALHRDARLWTHIRSAALARVAAELNPADFTARVAALTRRAETTDVGIGTSD